MATDSVNDDLLHDLVRGVPVDESPAKRQWLDALARSAVGADRTALYRTFVMLVDFYDDVLVELRASYEDWRRSQKERTDALVDRHLDELEQVLNAVVEDYTAPDMPEPGAPLEDFFTWYELPTVRLSHPNMTLADLAKCVPCSVPTIYRLHAQWRRKA